MENLANKTPPSISPSPQRQSISPLSFSPIKSSHSHTQSLTSNSILQTDQSLPEQTYQAPILRLKVGGAKPLLIQRWGFLTSKEFKYFRNKNSQWYAQQPLESLDLNIVNSVRAYKEKEQFYIEIHYDKSQNLTRRTDISRRCTLSVFQIQPKFLDPKPKKRTIPLVKSLLIASPEKRRIKEKLLVRGGEHAWTRRENKMYENENRLVFGVKTREEWRNWIVALRELGGLEVIVS